MAQHRVRQRTNVAVRDIVATVEQGPHLSTEQQVLRGA